MSGTKLIEKSPAGKLRMTAKLAGEVAKLRSEGTSLPKTIEALDKRTGEKTIHVVSPAYWRLEADALGSIENTSAAILAARKSGQRREIVALRAGTTVAEVKRIETAKNRKPIYVGKGTKKHLA